MKIDENSTLNTSKLQSTKVYESPRSEGNSSASVERTADTSDNIDLGSQASLLAQAQTAGSSERSANVQRLQALIQSGQYQVDPAALSHSIINAAINGY